MTLEETNMVNTITPSLVITITWSKGRERNNEERLHCSPVSMVVADDNVHTVSGDQRLVLAGIFGVVFSSFKLVLLLFNGGSKVFELVEKMIGFPGSSCASFCSLLFVVFVWNLKKITKCLGRCPCSLSAEEDDQMQKGYALFIVLFDSC